MDRSTVEDVYDFSSAAVLVGWIQHSLDIGEDYIECDFDMGELCKSMAGLS